MENREQPGRGGGGCPPDADPLEVAEQRLDAAEAKLERAEAEEREAETEIREAEAEIEAARRKPAEIEVKVDGVVKMVAPGTYIVSAFKAMVGVAADRELDVIHGSVFEPLNDDARITIHECESFVSHARTGGSS